MFAVRIQMAIKLDQVRSNEIKLDQIRSSEIK